MCDVVNGGQIFAELLSYLKQYKSPKENVSRKKTNKI